MTDALFIDSITAERHMRLHELQPGQSGHVVGFRQESALARRLIAMGVLPGRPVTVIRTALFADPMHVAFGPCSLSLRKADAAHILVSLEK